VQIFYCLKTDRGGGNRPSLKDIVTFRSGSGLLRFRRRPAALSSRLLGAQKPFDSIPYILKKGISKSYPFFQYGGGNADLPQISLKARAPRNSLIINAEVILHKHFPPTRPEKRFSPLISRHRTRVTGLQ